MAPSSPAWGELVKVLVSAGFGAFITVVGGRYLLKPYEARADAQLAVLQSTLTAEREEHKAVLERVEAQERTRFDFLHRQRVQVMRDTYLALCDLEDARDDFARSFGGFVGGPGPGDKWTQLRNAGDKFRKAFWPNRLLFTERTAEQLEALNRAYVAIVNVYAAQLIGERSSLSQGQLEDPEMIRRIEYDALKKTHENTRYSEASAAIEPLIKLVATEFRTIYGT